MGLRHLFLFLVLFVLALNGAFLYLIIYGITTPRVILIEGLILLTFFFLFYFYRRTIRPYILIRVFGHYSFNFISG